MATCCICKKKVTVISNNRLENNQAVCNTCFNHLQNIQITKTSNKNDVYKGRAWLESWIDTVDPSTKTILENRLKKSKELEAADAGNWAAREAVQKANHIEQEKHRERLLYFKTTTGYNFEGYSITSYKNIISGETVLGTGLLSELNASVSDTLGRQSSSLESKIKQAKKTTLDNLIERAASIKANALIGVNFAITTIGNNMIVVSVTGTAVTIEKIEDTDNNNANSNI